MTLMRKTLLWASRNHWLATRFPRYRFAQAAARRFMPGTTAESALDAAARLTDGIAAVLTRLGENVESADAADAVVAHYLEVLDAIGTRGERATISVKPTQLGLDLGDDIALRNLHTLAARAGELGRTLWVDMEDSSYVDRTLALFRDVLARHRNVGLCLQAYLYRTERDLESLLQETAAIRLVKGAYREPARIAFEKKADVDCNFSRLARTMLEAAASDAGSIRPVLGTHDTAMIERIRADAEAAGIDRDSWEIHMLYGIRSAEQLRLAREGHRVGVLISYGEEWFPWYVRRLAERPANIWFVVKSLFRR